MVSKNIQTPERSVSNRGLQQIRNSILVRALKEAGAFALIEILIAVSILSIILISVFSGVTTSARALADAKNRTIAMQIARSEMNMFIHSNMRGADISGEPVSEQTGFYLYRETARYDHPFLGQMPVSKTEITVKWQISGQSEREQEFKLNYIFSSQ